MILRCSILFLGAAIAGEQLCAQVPEDTVRLEGVEVIAVRQGLFGAGMKVQRLDSAALDRRRAASVGDLLANTTPVFVKSYGLGSLATTSFRGGGASHTAVLWNGFNIGSPMNGQIDLSLIPMFAADDVGLQYGGSSALWGSGAVGGTVQMSTTPSFNAGLQVDGLLALGSFGDRRQQVRVRFGRERWGASVGFHGADARNDFEIRNRTGSGTPRRQSNAGSAQYGLLSEFHGRPTARQRFSLRYWVQSTDRAVPPTLVQEQSTARQEDVSHRLTAEWQQAGPRVIWMARTALFDERLDWYANAVDGAAQSRSLASISEVEGRIRVAADHALNIGANNSWARARSDGYPEGPRQNRAALYAAYRYSRGERWAAALSLRQEMLDRDMVPFTASLGGNHRIVRGVELKLNVARIYRVPTFNDLYWRPGGTPDLRAENGHSGDLGVSWRGAHGLFTWRTEVTWFNRWVHDWIIWLPGPVYWSPRNVQEVWSRGVESDTELRVRMGGAVLTLGVMTNHVVSTNQRATTVNDASVDKQMIYVPMYSGNARAGIEWHGFSVNISGVYTGYRYLSTDNRDFLEPYALLNASATYRLRSKGRCTWSIFIHGNNLLDADYQVMLNRPMPLRNHQAGVSVRIHHPPRSKPTTP